MNVASERERVEPTQKIMLIVFIPFFIFSDVNAGPIPISIDEDELHGSSCGACVFPFIFSGRMHDTCTNIDGDSRKWCSKVENFDDNLMEWEYCDEDKSCPGMSISSTPQMSVDPKNEPGNCYCGVPNYPDDQDKIVGGKPIAVGVYPWQVALIYGSALGKPQKSV